MGNELQSNCKEVSVSRKRPVECGKDGLDDSGLDACDAPG